MEKSSSLQLEKDELLELTIYLCSLALLVSCHTVIYLNDDWNIEIIKIK